jgi:hypothetical protein
MPEFIAATEHVDANAITSPNEGWRFRVVGDDVVNTLRDAGAHLETGEPSNYMFIPLQSA